MHARDQTQLRSDEAYRVVFVDLVEEGAVEMVSVLAPKKMHDHCRG